MKIERMNEPINCIYCGCEDIAANIIDGSSYSRKVFCMKCERSWHEVFEFTGIIRDEEE